MDKPSKRFSLILATFIVAMVSVPIIGHTANEFVGYVLFLTFVVLLPLTVVTGRDLLISQIGRREKRSASKIFLRILSSLPVMVFALLSLVGGTCIILWVLYNVFVERQPEFSQPTMFVGVFGIGPALIFFGLKSIAIVFGKR